MRLKGCLLVSCSFFMVDNIWSVSGPKKWLGCMCHLPLSINVFISSKSLLLNFSGRPPNLPLARAAARPAADRSRIRFRSNSANAANRWNINWPVELDLSIVIFSCKLWKLTPRLFKRLTIVIKSPIFCQADLIATQRVYPLNEKIQSLFLIPDDYSIHHSCVL